MPEHCEMLHVYSQEAWHDEAFIVGTRCDLQRLRDLLTAVLAEPRQADIEDMPARIETSTNDGEGYSLQIILATEEEMHGYSLPYTADYAQYAYDYLKRHHPAMRHRREG